MYQERKQRGRETWQEGALGPTLRSSSGVIIRARWGDGRSPEGTRGQELRRQEWGGFISWWQKLVAEVMGPGHCG